MVVGDKVTEGKVQQPGCRKQAVALIVNVLVGSILTPTKCSDYSIADTSKGVFAVGWGWGRAAKH